MSETLVVRGRMIKDYRPVMTLDLQQLGAEEAISLRGMGLIQHKMSLEHFVKADD